MIDLSIVIPHHDRADLLKECLAPISLSIPVFIIRGGTFAENCNKGFSLVNTEYVMFLNDDVVINNFPREMNSDILGFPSYQCEKIITGVSIHPENPWPFTEEEGIPAFPLGSCFIIKSRLFSDLGGFNEAYRNGCEDIDLFLHAIEAGAKISYNFWPVYHFYSQSLGRGKYIAENRAILLKAFTNERLQNITIIQKGEKPCSIK